jgi:hypothetical protein
MKPQPTIEKRKYRKSKPVSLAKAISDIKYYRKWLTRLETKHRREMTRAKKVLSKKVKVLVKAI